MRTGVARVTDSTSDVGTLGLTGWSVVPLEIEIDGRRMREGRELSPAEFYTLFQQANAVPVTIRNRSSPRRVTVKSHSMPPRGLSICVYVTRPTSRATRFAQRLSSKSAAPSP